eukprot:256804_1
MSENTVNMSDKDTIAFQKQRIEELESKVKNYQKIVDDIIDDTLHNTNSNSDIDEKTEMKKSDAQIDWNNMKTQIENNNVKYILSTLHSKQIDLNIANKERFLTTAVSYGGIEIVKILLNLGFKITDQHLNDARSKKKYDIVELLLLTRCGIGANKIQNDCDIVWKEDVIISSFLSTIETLEMNNLGKDIIGVVENMILGRKPISSFLISVAMKLNSSRIWKCIYKVMKEIIYDPTDTFGWLYLNKYLMNSTFLFRQYYLDSISDETKYINNGNNKVPIVKKGNETNRKIQDLNVEELIYYFHEKMAKFDAAIREDWYDDSLESDPCPDTMTSARMKLMNIALRKQHISGQVFMNMKGKQFENFLISSANGGITREHCSGSIYIRMDPFKRYTKRIEFPVPFIVMPEYVLYSVVKMAKKRSINEAANDLGGPYEKWTKNKENWQFILNYGNEYVGIKLRQDAMVNGMKCKYNKQDLILRLGGRGISFNPIKFYDFSIYLNKLLIECGVVNDQFQTDVETIFDTLIQSRMCQYRKGPLKKRERCQIKCELDYNDQSFPTSACLLDIIRCTLTFQTMNDLINGIKYFENEIKSQNYCLKEILRVKNGFSESFTFKKGNYNNRSKPIMQYVDIKYNVKIQNSLCKDLIGEVQFLLSDMAKYKKKSHKFYGITRQADYFQVFSSLSAMKNDVSNQFKIAFQQFNHKRIIEICIDLNISTFKKLEIQFSQYIWEWESFIYTTKGYEKGNKCLEVLLSMYADTPLKFFTRKYAWKTPFESRNPLMVAVLSHNFEAVKFIISSLENDEERKKMIYIKENGTGKGHSPKTFRKNVLDDEFVGAQPELKQYFLQFV